MRPEWNFAEYVGRYTWRNLHILRLESMNIIENDVTTFLIGHAASLKRLQVGVYKNFNFRQREANMQDIIRFRHGTLGGLLTCVRERMRLEKLNMTGDVVEEINPLPPYKYELGLYDDDWLRVPNAAHTAARALAVERFVSGETRWDNESNRRGDEE